SPDQFQHASFAGRARRKIRAVNRCLAASGTDAATGGPKHGAGMTIEQALKQARAVFRDAGIDDPAIESEFLMASVLGQSRAHVLLARRERLNLAAEQKFDAWVKERRARKPLAYITGEQPFYGESFKVTPEVLI